MGQSTHHTSGSSTPAKTTFFSSTYNAIMTPLNFILFLFSLMVIDQRYSHMRTHLHSPPGRCGYLPKWLHALCFRPQQQQQPADGSTNANNTNTNNRNADHHDEEYYHSYQRKLIKMEATEAFQLRGAMLITLVLGAAGSLYAVGYLATRIYNRWVPTWS